MIKQKQLWTAATLLFEKVQSAADTHGQTVDAELTNQSARFALVIEYVRSIHPWANSRC